MADSPIGAYASVTSILPERDRTMPRKEKVYDPSTGNKDKDQDQQKSDDGKEHHFGGAGHEEFSDEISVLGIPKEEMTPHVREAINVLLEEIDQLKAELLNVRSHKVPPKEQDEKDSVLQVLSHRALGAKAAHAVSRVDQDSVPYSFIYIQVDNAFAVGNMFGPDAFEELMVQTASALREGTMLGDVLGRIENNDFGIIIPGSSLEEAKMKADELLILLNGRNLVWQGNPVSVVANYGITEINRGDTLDSILKRAQQNYSDKS